jgi:hypothetical protein
MQAHALVECFARRFALKVNRHAMAAASWSRGVWQGLSSHNSGTRLACADFRGRAQWFTLPLVGEDRTETGRHRVSVAEAARILDTTAEAIRSRIKRGTLSSTKEGASVYVLLSPDQMALGQRPYNARTTDQSQYERDALMSEMRGRIEDLRVQLESERAAHAEARRLLAAALERIPPQLEAPQEPSESPPEPTEQPGRVGPQTPLREAPQSTWESLGEEPERAEPRSTAVEAQEGAERRSLWQRLFGG